MHGSFSSSAARVQAAAHFSKSQTAVSLFAPLVAHSYDVVVVDPPWHFKTWSPAGQTSKSASGQYRTMSLAEIMALPVRELLKDDAVVYLWTTGACCRRGIATMEAWGITYTTNFAWRKVTRNGKMPMGHWILGAQRSRDFLLGTVGKPRCFLLPSFFDGIAREHSRKPDEFYDMIAKKTPGLRRADVFAREKREGWDCWGDEVGKFSSVSVEADARTILVPGRKLIGVKSVNAHNPHQPTGEPIGADESTDGKVNAPQITLITKRDVPSLMSKRISLDAEWQAQERWLGMSDDHRHGRPRSLWEPPAPSR